MEYKGKESIHQEFERFMRDEMDDLEKKYIKSDNYKTMLEFVNQNAGKFKKIILYEKKIFFNFSFVNYYNFFSPVFIPIKKPIKCQCKGRFIQR